MLCERRTATNLYYNYHKLNQQNPEDMPYAKLLMGSYFGISVLYIELNCNNRYTRYDQYLLFKKQWTDLFGIYMFWNSTSITTGYWENIYTQNHLFPGCKNKKWCGYFHHSYLTGYINWMSEVHFQSLYSNELDILMNKIVKGKGYQHLVVLLIQEVLS